LEDAEGELHKAIEYARRVNDSLTISWWNSFLASVLQEQGKFSEASTALHAALSIGRSKHATLYLGLALIVLGQLRLAQATSIKISTSGIKTLQNEKERMLKRAKKTLQHALTFEGLEADNRIDGRLALAQAYLQLNEVTLSHEQATKALEEANQANLNWLLVRAERVLGSITAALNQFEQAEQHFEQALRMLRKNGMRLEYARTLRDYGIALLHYSDKYDKERYQGFDYLQEAIQIFEQCKAIPEMQALQTEIEKYEPVAQRSIRP